MRNNTRFKLKWTTIDIIAILCTLIIASVLSLFIYFMPSEEISSDSNARVEVIYDGTIVASENLIPDPAKNQSDPRYIILFPKEINTFYDSIYPSNTKIGNNTKLLGDLVIEIKDKSIQIIKETSPNHICSNQGVVSKLNVPLTCAPNYVIVIIRDSNNDGPDIIL